METVAIIGVGLIGGSFALALRKAGFQGQIIGVSSPRTVREALDLGIIDDALPLAEAAAMSDLLYLAQPISAILETLTRLDSVVRAGALVTDAGSTKVRIVEQARQHLQRAVFLGGHPMAGKEVRGAAAAEADLFNERTYVLTPVDPSDKDAPQVQEFVEWVGRIGARPLYLTPDEHDRVIAFVSHLPQLMSTTLASMLGRLPGLPDPDLAAGPGLLDSTRLAKSSFEIWRDILDTNYAYINEALLSYMEALKKVHTELLEGQLEERFNSGAAFANKLRQPRQQS